MQAVLDMSRLVAAHGHRVVLATMDATDVPGDWGQSKPNVPDVVKLEASRMSSAWLSRSSLRTLAQLSQEADLVHLHTPWDLCNVQIASMLHKAGVPFVLTIHGMLDDYCMRQKAFKKNVFLKLFGRHLLRYATTVHFTAEAERDQALPWIPGKDRSVIQTCAIDLEPYEVLPGPQLALEAFPQIQPDSKKVLFLSRLHPKKGIELLLEAGAILRDRGQPVQLLIAGPGDGDYVQQLKALNGKLGLNGHSQFLGMVRGAQKVSLYQAADVFVLPTYQENFGLVLAEAMAAATPVVTTRGTDIWRELEQAGAKIVDSSSPSIADAIETCLKDSSQRERVGQQGREFVRQWLNKDRVFDGYEKIYRDTLEKHSREKS